jgi:hypothetical protein
MEANVSICWVTKRLRHSGKDLKPEGAPQPDRWCISFDDRIELHRPVAVHACLFKDMVAQCAAYALAASRRMDDKARIGNVRPGARVDGMSIRAPDDASIVIHGDNGAPGRLPHPPSACPRFGSRGIPRQGQPGGTLLFQDQPDSWPVLCRRLTYHHVASIAHTRIHLPRTERAHFLVTSRPGASQPASPTSPAQPPHHPAQRPRWIMNPVRGPGAGAAWLREVG